MAIDLAEKSSGPAPEFLASSPPDSSKHCTENCLTDAPHSHSLCLCFKLKIKELFIKVKKNKQNPLKENERTENRIFSGPALPLVSLWGARGGEKTVGGSLAEDVVGRPWPNPRCQCDFLPGGCPGPPAFPSHWAPGRGRDRGPPGEQRGKRCLFAAPAESPEEAAGDQESEDDLSASRTSLERQAPHRGNTMVHVCWHRNTSVSMVDFSVAVEVGQAAGGQATGTGLLSMCALWAGRCTGLGVCPFPGRLCSDGFLLSSGPCPLLSRS